MSFKGGLNNAQISFTETAQSGLLAGTAYPWPPQRIQSYFASGTAVDQVDGVSQMQLALSASTPQIVNLLTGLTDLLGNTLTVARIRFIAIKVISAVDGANLLVGDAVTNEFDGFLSAAAKLTVFPSSLGNDGFFLISAPNLTGMPVSASNCSLKFDPGTAAMSVILIVGTASV